MVQPRDGQFCSTGFAEVVKRPQRDGVLLESYDIWQDYACLEVAVQFLRCLAYERSLAVGQQAQRAGLRFGDKARVFSKKDKAVVGNARVASTRQRGGKGRFAPATDPEKASCSALYGDTAGMKDKLPVPCAQQRTDLVYEGVLDKSVGNTGPRHANHSARGEIDSVVGTVDNPDKTAQIHAMKSGRDLARF